jgi:oxygen-independent coproporphyrinogen-3 oxidase
MGGGGVTKLVSPGGRIERIFNAKYPREYIMHADKIGRKFERVKEFISEELFS